MAHYGYGYRYGEGRIEPGSPIPDELEWLRERAGRLAVVPPKALAEALVTR